MASLKAIRTRITSVKNTQKITKAMKMVAAAKLRRAQENLMQGRPYATHLMKTIRNLATFTEEETHPLLRNSEGTRTLLVVVTSDKGLCGGFNSSLNKATEQFIKENLDSKLESIDIATIGRKGQDYLKRRTEKLGFSIAHYFEGIFDRLGMEAVSSVGEQLVADFLEEKYDRVYVLYNEFKSAMTQIVRVERLLPIIPEEFDEGDSDTFEEYDFEPTPEVLFAHLLPLHINTQLFRALQESYASEMGARMTAMESASKNATEMIDKLTLEFNRARQAAITTELIEIISGANAL